MSDRCCSTSLLSVAPTNGAVNNEVGRGKSSANSASSYLEKQRLARLYNSSTRFRSFASLL